jgi:Cdc6-like AAA superfamily ATPase
MAHTLSCPHSIPSWRNFFFPAVQPNIKVNLIFFCRYTFFYTLELRLPIRGIIYHTRIRLLANMRTSPNIIITGTPGVGKTVHSEQVSQETGLRHLSVNQIAKERECHDGYDQERQSWIIDEDKVRNK